MILFYFILRHSIFYFHITHDSHNKAFFPKKKYWLTTFSFKKTIENKTLIVSFGEIFQIFKVFKYEKNYQKID